MSTDNRAFPRHIAIIMDGNGRWAKHRGKPRAAGHQQGFRNTRDIVEACARHDDPRLVKSCAMKWPAQS